MGRLDKASHGGEIERALVAQAERHFEATRTALRYYGEWYGAYPYGHITIVDPAWQSDAGGMEYPTLFTAGNIFLGYTDAKIANSNLDLVVSFVY